MTSAAARLALVPLFAVAVVLSVSGIHGRRTHDPTRAVHALDILIATDDERAARLELDSFFESGWVGWDVKTQVEIECGATRADLIQDPVACVSKAQAIVADHHRVELRSHRTYTVLAWSSFAPGILVLVLGVLQLVAAGNAAAAAAGKARARRNDRVA